MGLGDITGSKPYNRNCLRISNICSRTPPNKKEYTHIYICVCVYTYISILPLKGHEGIFFKWRSSANTVEPKP